MGSFSIWHWIIVLLIVLLLFGAGKLPTVMGDIAKGIKAFKAGLKDQDEEEAPPATPPAVATPPAATPAAAPAASMAQAAPGEPAVQPAAAAVGSTEPAKPVSGAPIPPHQG